MELVLLTTLIFSIILGVVLCYPLLFKPKIALGPFKKLNDEKKLVKANLKLLRNICKLVIIFLVISMIAVIIIGANDLVFYKEAYSILAVLATILILLIL